MRRHGRDFPRMLVVSGTDGLSRIFQDEEPVLLGDLPIGPMSAIWP